MICPTPRAPARTRRGMILPLVLVCLLVALAASSALQQSTWRAMRGAQSQWQAQRALYEADGAVVNAIATWAADSLAATPIGQRRRSEQRTAQGWRVITTITRSAPLVAVVEASASRDAVGSITHADALTDPTRVQRTVRRVLRLTPPAFVVNAAVTVTGDIIVDGALLDGRDRVGALDAARDDCGPWRDTASLDAVHALRIEARNAPTLYGGSWTLAASAQDSLTTWFDRAWANLLPRVVSAPRTADSAIAPLAPWRASVLRPVMPSATSVTVDGVSTVRGLLAVDGDLVLRGALRVDGLLIVRGALDVRTGSLDVSGAVIVRDVSRMGSTMGANTRVTYAPCLVGRALAAVSVPRVAPFAVWHTP